MKKLLLEEPIYLSNLKEMKGYKFENEMGFPPSYIHFATSLGYGLLCSLFIVYTPMGNHPDSWYNQSEYIKKSILNSIENNWVDYEPDGNELLLKNAVPFAMSENGEYLFWDIRKNIDGEFPIYVLGASMGAIWFGANNLFEFIDKCGDNEKIKNMMGTGYKALPLQFQPYKPYGI